jgi:hypothetical protein
MEKSVISRFINYRFIFFTVICLYSSTSRSQSVKHHISVLNTTHVDFTWHYQITPTTYKLIEYFIVEDSFGAPRVAFNACDVCWANHLGYDQVGTFMQCNNCGNQYPIDNLGSAGTGGCWPGYLDFNIVGDSIEITHANLITGAYYFLTLINEVGVESVSNIPSNYSLTKNENVLILNTNSNLKKEIYLFSIEGKKVTSISSSDAEIRINLKNLASSIYMIAVKENDKLYQQKFLID